MHDISIIRTYSNSPVFVATGRWTIDIIAGSAIRWNICVEMNEDIAVTMPSYLHPGTDYEIVLGYPTILSVIPSGTSVDNSRAAVIGGFHFAPGAHATTRSGGDDVPTINPDSIWDAGFRPACPDPRGMALVEGPDGPLWVDIYLTGRRHLDEGTSRHGAEIADGDRALPQRPGGGEFERLDYTAACAIAAHHGKRLLTHAEFAAAAYGVTERSSDDDKARLTGLSAPRTSRAGLMQATGQRWTWGHDDPEDLRPSFLGGSWLGGAVAGSRSAFLDFWPEYSDDDVGLRLASDHLTIKSIK